VIGVATVEEFIFESDVVVVGVATFGLNFEGLDEVNSSSSEFEIFSLILLDLNNCLKIFLFESESCNL